MVVIVFSNLLAIDDLDLLPAASLERICCQVVQSHVPVKLKVKAFHINRFQRNTTW